MIIGGVKIFQITFISTKNELKKELYEKIELEYFDAEIKKNTVFIKEKKSTKGIMEIIESKNKSKSPKNRIFYTITDELGTKYTINSKKDFEVIISIL